MSTSSSARCHVEVEGQGDSQSFPTFPSSIVEMCGGEGLMSMGWNQFILCLCGRVKDYDHFL